MGDPTELAAFRATGWRYDACMPCFSCATDCLETHIVESATPAKHIATPHAAAAPAAAAAAAATATASAASPALSSSTSASAAASNSATDRVKVFIASGCLFAFVEFWFLFCDLL